MITRVSILAACVGLAVALFTATEVHAKIPKPHRLAPPVHCTMANRMDIFVDEDDILWECTCEPLATGFTCHWQVIGGVDAVATRKRTPKQHRLRIVAYAIPAVVA